MAMVVKNNMSAVRTLSTLNKNNSALQDSLSKVSSGLKINTAKDDASGYAISERMRVQIRSLDQATQNSQNASSLMKNAEGAVERTVEILRTLKQKAIDAATDTNTDDDRATIQKEIDQFIDQIDDNALVTFNGKYLLEGSRAQSGSAVATHMTNNNLATNTNLNTALISLSNRNGENLEINTGDRVTVSFVMGGKTYTSILTSVSALTKLGDIYSMLNTAVNGTTTATNAFAVITSSTKNLDTTNFSNTITQGVTIRNNATGTSVDALGTIDTESVFSTTSTINGQDVVINYKLIKDNTTVPVPSARTAGSGTITVTADLQNVVLGGKTYDLKAYVDASGTSKTIDTSFGKLKIDNSSSMQNIITVTSSGLASAFTATTLTTNFKFGLDLSLDDVTYNQGTAVSSDTTIGTSPSGKIETTKDGENALTFMASGTGLQGQISGLSISIADSEGNVKKATNTALDAFKTTIYAANQTADGSVSFQVGAAANQAIKVGLMDMRSEALGLKGRDGTTIQVTTRAAANAAVAAFDNAINKALDQQTTIGAISARLDYTASNLTTSSENVQAAESTIRDADMAKEMTEYTKNNVLLQAAQSMLAQANQNSSAVLSLLQ